MASEIRKTKFILLGNKQDSTHHRIPGMFFTGFPKSGLANKIRQL